MFKFINNQAISISHYYVKLSPQNQSLYVILLLCYFTPYFYILGSGKEEVLGRDAGLLPEPKYALDGEFSLVFKNVYTFYNRCTESHYLPAPYPNHNCDHISPHIFIYWALARKRCWEKIPGFCQSPNIYIFSLRAQCSPFT